MKVIDSEFIVQLASLAPIVPIVAKADTMTLLERMDYLLEIQSTFQLLQGQTSYPILFDFKESLETGFLSRDHLPSEVPVNRISSFPKSSWPVDLQAANYDSQPEDEEESETADDIAEEQYELQSVVSQGSDENKPVEGLEGTTLGSYFYSEGDIQTAQEEKPHQVPIAAQSVPSSQISGLPRIPNVFAVVCDTNPRGLREFPYGTLEIYNKEHSDFRRLQELFFESGEHILQMRRQTELMSIALYKEGRRVAAWQKTAKLLLEEGRKVVNRVMLTLGWTGLVFYVCCIVLALGNVRLSGKYFMCGLLMLKRMLFM